MHDKQFCLLINYLHAHQPAQQPLKCNAILAVSQVAKVLTFDGVACCLLRAFRKRKLTNPSGLSPIVNTLMSDGVEHSLLRAVMPTHVNNPLMPVPMPYSCGAHC